jgi:hypothetical protein
MRKILNHPLNTYEHPYAECKTLSEKHDPTVETVFSAMEDSHSESGDEFKPLPNMKARGARRSLNPAWSSPSKTHTSSLSQSVQGLAIDSLRLKGSLQPIDSDPSPEVILKRGLSINRTISTTSSDVERHHDAALPQKYKARKIGAGSFGEVSEIIDTEFVYKFQKYLDMATVYGTTFFTTVKLQKLLHLSPLK